MGFLTEEGKDGVLPYSFPWFWLGTLGTSGRENGSLLLFKEGEFSVEASGCL